MNRLFITILSFCLLTSAFAQKPSEGNIATEAQLNLNTVGSFFPLNLKDNLVLPTLRFRYFLSSDLAIRADLNLRASTVSSNFAENADGSGALGELKNKDNSYGIGLGVEKHFGGNSRFSPFVGGGFNYALGNLSSETSNSDGFSYEMDRVVTTENKQSLFGVGAFLGADYWINNSFYLGGQIDYGFSSTNVKEGTRSSVLAGGTPVESTTPGSSSSAFGQGITPSFRIGFLLNGGPAAVAKPAVAKVVDSDNDGVPDDIDKCTGTQRGETVTAEGCPTYAAEIRLLAKNIYFETASDKIKAESYESLNKVAEILVAHPAANLSIEGHTDSQGDETKNMTLSQKRAQSVLNYLAGKGVDVGHLSAVGYGETKPVVDNSTKEGRALNRRVELLVTY